MFFGALKELNGFEKLLWGVSVLIVSGAFFLSGGGDRLTLIASLIGVTALIFVSKGMVLGQALTVVFAVFYGIVSYYFHYYGEMITYLGMTAPIALAAVISWARHPYEGTKQVEVAMISGKTGAVVLIMSLVVSLGAYFLLKRLGNANLVLSTVSVFTSFAASSLTFLRSPYYAVGYCANDGILIGLWVLASLEEPSYVPMIFCFVMFFINDLYGFFSWRRLRRDQGWEKPNREE